MNRPTDIAVHRQRVPFHDCDPLGIVWHGHYYKYLEIARTLLFETFAINHAFFRESGLHLVVSESRCRHSAPLRFEDELRVTARFVEVDLMLKISYEVWNESTGRRAARATTSLVAMRGPEMLFGTPNEILMRLQSVSEVDA